MCIRDRYYILVNNKVVYKYLFLGYRGHWGLHPSSPCDEVWWCIVLKWASLQLFSYHHVQGYQVIVFTNADDRPPLFSSAFPFLSSPFLPSVPCPPFAYRHFGTRTFRHQDSSAPVQNGAEVSRDNSAPDFYWCRTVRQCRNTSRYFGTIRQKYIWYGLLFCHPYGGTLHSVHAFKIVTTLAPAIPEIWLVPTKI